MTEFRIPFKRFTLVDGCFDPLHPGHLRYFEAAESLKLPVVCLVASDEYVRTKHALLLTQRDRCEILASIRQVDIAIPSLGSTAEHIRLLRPSIYFKGQDWKGRLPVAEVRACEEVGAQILFASTPLRSSSEILRSFSENRSV